MDDKSKEVAPEKLDRNMRVVQAPGLEGLQWHCPKQAPFQLAGFAWFDSDRAYRRMPVRPIERILKMT